MTYTELIQEIKKLKLEEKRSDTKELLEIVIRTEHLPALNPILEKYFGPAQKRSGQNPTKEIRILTNALGGIRENQALYCLEDGPDMAFAMIWPWSSGTLATVKVAKTAK